MLHRLQRRWLWFRSLIWRVPLSRLVEPEAFSSNLRHSIGCLRFDETDRLDCPVPVIMASSQANPTPWGHIGREARLGDATGTFLHRLVDVSGLVVDCRPCERVDERSATAFAALRRACEAVGWSYRLVGELDPVRAANLRWLAGYRHRRLGESEGQAAAVMRRSPFRLR
jgi:hypothetical protein